MSQNVIISNRSDISTNDVIDWIEYLDKSYIRFNGENFVDGSEINLVLNNDEFNFSLADWKKKGAKNDNIWFRRFFPYDYYEHIKNGLKENKADILTNVFGEINTVFNFVLTQNTDEKHKRVRKINKLESLFKAKECGVRIPDTLVTTSKAKLVAFFKKHKKLIVKPLSDSLSFNYEKRKISAAVYTKAIDLNLLDQIEETFFVSLFQELLEKKYEIRSFYFNDKFYSMAIFSQNNSKTKVDFRHYDNLNPNRNVPYKLPKEVEEKLRKLMNKLKLDTGSIDLVRTNDNEFVFLEVNPAGQFGMVSIPCNYKLEKIIAEKVAQEF